MNYNNRNRMIRRQRDPYFQPRSFQPMPQMQRLDFLPECFNFDFDSRDNRKPWINQKQDITDYFNYGFNETTFKRYVQKVRNMGDYYEKQIKKQKEKQNEEIDAPHVHAEEQQLFKLDKETYKIQTNEKTNIFKGNLPIELGGVSQTMLPEINELKAFIEQFITNRFKQQTRQMYLNGVQLTILQLPNLFDYMQKLLLTKTREDGKNQYEIVRDGLKKLRTLFEAKLKGGDVYANSNQKISRFGALEIPIIKRSKSKSKPRPKKKYTRYSRDRQGDKIYKNKKQAQRREENKRQRSRSRSRKNHKSKSSHRKKKDVRSPSNQKDSDKINEKSSKQKRKDYKRKNSRSPVKQSKHSRRIKYSNHRKRQDDRRSHRHRRNSPYDRQRQHRRSRRSPKRSSRRSPKRRRRSSRSRSPRRSRKSPRDRQSSRYSPDYRKSRSPDYRKPSTPTKEKNRDKDKDKKKKQSSKNIKKSKSPKKIRSKIDDKIKKISRSKSTEKTKHKKSLKSLKSTKNIKNQKSQKSPTKRKGLVIKKKDGTQRIIGGQRKSHTITKARNVRDDAQKVNRKKLRLKKKNSNKSYNEEQKWTIKTIKRTLSNKKSSNND